MADPLRIFPGRNTTGCGCGSTMKPDDDMNIILVGKRHGKSRVLSINSTLAAGKSRNATNIILSAGAQASIDGANTQIKALQAKLPKSAIGSFSGRYNLEGKADTRIAIDEPRAIAEPIPWTTLAKIIRE